MFTWWGRAVVRLRWVVLGCAVAFVALGVTWGAGVFGALTSGGFDDPDSPSSRAQARIEQEIGRQDADLIALYTSPTSTVDDPAVQAAVAATVSALRARPDIGSAVSAFDPPNPALVSTDRRSTYVAVRFSVGGEDAKLATLDQVTPLLDRPGLTLDVGGFVPFIRDANEQIESDITRAEVLSLPVLLILLIVIFRGFLAATTPLLVGGLAILGAFVVVRVLAQVTEVSTFAINIITMLGLGMAIDYALFVLSRFREELHAGRDVPGAVVATLATAGRTVLVSGLTVALALSSLLLFPMAFLRSMGWGGMAAVLVAMVSALTVLPALLAVLGHRVKGRAPKVAVHSGAWARLAHSVMRRPVLYVVLLVVLLVGLAAPFVRAQYGGFDERVLPEGTPTRTVAARIADGFPGGGTAPILVLVSGVDQAAAQVYAATLGAVPGITSVRVVASQGDSTLLAAIDPTEPSSAAARDTVERVRAVPPPAGAEVLVGGRAAANLDQVTGLASRLPWMALLVGLVTILLLFLAFGSVLLPIKAVLMNVVSIGASFGVVVWVFQDGHLSNLLGFTPTGFLEPTNLILLLAVLFGLSTDYEVFLLSRVREEWDRTGDNTQAVAAGLQRTGGIITAAALLLAIVIGGFATGGTTTIKLLGVGTVVAIAVDALLVRALLVPATMRLLGRWNWWAPGPLARVYRKYGIREEAAEREEVRV